MKKLFLSGHTGSNNRGCEAIVRSSAGIFKRAGYNDQITLATFSAQQDKRRKLDEIMTLLSYGNYSGKIQRVASALCRKIFGSKTAGQNIIQKPLWSKLSKESLVLNVGGDTYCYSFPTVSVALNAYAHKNNIPCILWGCTVEIDRLGKKVMDDLKRYTSIVVRESMTEKALIKAGIDSNKVLRCCDPAFTLEKSEVALPEAFKEGNTLGINLSNLVLTDELTEAVCYFIDKVLSETDMNICFVPHVYNVDEGNEDIKVHRVFKEKYSDNKDRISFVEEDYSCTELKYIISKCRFFVGARTHSIIAAYSSMVPALALGYSMKSVGIATDIFGSSEDYVLSFKDVSSKEDIYRKMSFIFENEQKIRAHYESFMPEYVKTVSDVAEKLIERYLK